jgi:hypothetical protein
MVGPQRGGEETLGQILGLVGLHEQFLEDHEPFGLDLVGPERGAPHDLGEDVQAELEIVGEEPHVERGVVLRREGVQLAADGVDRLGDVGGGAAVAALEQQVFEEVRRAGLIGLLVASDRNPEPLRDRAHFACARSPR